MTGRCLFCDAEISLAMWDRRGACLPCYRERQAAEQAKKKTSK